MTQPVDRFSEPFFAYVDDQLIPTDNKTFSMTRRWLSGGNQLLANVSRSGSAKLEWVLDLDGQFFETQSLGLLRKTLIQKLGLTRQKELYQIEQPRPITVDEFNGLIANIKDRYAEAPVAQATREILRQFPDEHIIDRETMNKLMGG